MKSVPARTMVSRFELLLRPHGGTGAGQGDSAGAEGDGDSAGAEGDGEPLPPGLGEGLAEAEADAEADAERAGDSLGPGDGPGDPDGPGESEGLAVGAGSAKKPLGRRSVGPGVAGAGVAHGSGVAETSGLGESSGVLWSVGCGSVVAPAIEEIGVGAGVAEA
jgi:hypothetical protein